MIILLGLSCISILTGTTLGIMERSKMVFTKYNNSEAFVLVKNKFRNNLNVSLVSTIELYDSLTVVHNSWDLVQKKLKCCGSEGPDDWLIHRPNIPYSCIFDVSDL